MESTSYLLIKLGLIGVENDIENDITEIHFIFGSVFLGLSISEDLFFLICSFFDFFSIVQEIKII